MLKKCPYSRSAPCNRGTGKSYLMKVIYNAILKTLLYHCNPEFFLLGPTGIPVVNISGTKPGIKPG